MDILGRRFPPTAAVCMTAGMCAVSLLLAGCGQIQATSDAGGEPPVLHLVAGANALGGVGAPTAAGAFGAMGMPSGFDGWVLAGPLPDQPTSAALWVWARGPADAAAVQRLAHALGLTGVPQRHSHGWVVTGATGVLRVADLGGHRWSFTRTDRVNCPPFTVDVDVIDANSTVGCAMAAPAGLMVPHGPDEATTRSAAAPLLAALNHAGSDWSAANVSVGAPDSVLSLSPVISGMRTQGLETSVIVDQVGIAAADGRLDPPTLGKLYPLRTAKAAFDELVNRPRPEMPVYCGTLPAKPGVLLGSPQSPRACPTPTPTRVTGARLGLVLSYDMTGTLVTEVVVPAWFFDVAGDAVGPAVMAIAPSFVQPLVRSAPPSPVAVPGGLPGAGSGASGSSGSGGGSTGGGGISTGVTSGPVPPVQTPAVSTGP
jgi:hypothetical protein